MQTLHVVCGLPAVGKTTYALKLAKELGAAFFDSDTATDLIIQAAHRAAGLDPHDRDSQLYKETYREPVYETLFALADQNLAHTDVIIAGPFTQELVECEAWECELLERFSPHSVEIHHLQISEEVRLQQMKQRCALRDEAKYG
ncbi:AAA family ATPase [Rubritalea spongiae]|uniref:AAA family ATPase n=1 Tax=Rubritalea spongiae TaxID=430797 RepID=A0ABW5E4W7_9BACT